MTDLENTKQQRKAARASFTKTANKLQDLITSDDPALDDVEAVLDQLQEKYKTLKNIDEKFLELLQRKGCNQDEYDKEYEAAEEYYEKLSNLKVKCNRLKTKVSSSTTSSNSSSSLGMSSQITKQKLPEIELVKFDGDPKNWLTFWSQFSKINEDTRIDARDKFQYLLQSTKPDSVARQIVESFPATEINYGKALDYLKERFGKESVLIQIYVRELLKLVITDKTQVNVLQLYDKLQTQLRALESLGVTQDKFAHMLLPLIESALLTDLLKIYQRQRNTSAEPDVLLQTLIVKIHNGSKELCIRAIYDTGSMKSYISADVAQSMQSKCIGETKIKQSLFGGVETPENVYKNYIIGLSDMEDKYMCKVEVVAQNRICSEIKQIPSGPWLHELKLHGIKVNDLENKHLKIDKEIKLLIGADIAGKLLTGKIVNFKCGLTAIGTKLGWTLMGKLKPGTKPNSESTASLVISSLLVKDRCISDLWKLDVLGITEPPINKTKAELQEDTHRYFEETLSINSEGRYEVALPWILDNKLLPDNKINAEKSIFTARRKLINSGKFNDYCDVFESWLSLGIIEWTTAEKLRGVHYLPHRAVIKENSSTNIRPVFHASSHLPGFPSLNDCLSTGPNLIEMIPSILNRFRMNYVGVTADIEKAFLQIAIREKDRDFLRFLWFDKENREQVEVYRHQRVVFGITCSPYLLAATLLYHLDRVPENLKQTADILKTAFYVDNCVTSLNSEIEMKKFYIESKLIMSLGHFNLRCWKSNLTSEIFEENSSKEEGISLLGLIWHTNTDTLSCKVEQVVNSLEPISKRTVLAVAHQVFDIVGYTATVMLIPKLILQETWNLKLKWDDVLPEDLTKKFKSWQQNLHFLSLISIPRWFGLKPIDQEISFHLFCDSSKKAYGTCVFIRVENDDSVIINLVQARSRVAPLKPITIPRLELLACNIGSRLLFGIIKDLNLSRANIYCWTDSTTALCWIQRKQNWGTFIQNRVTEIQSLTSPQWWRHISGSLNPADLLTRGCSAEQLVERKWWEGPDWLREKEKNWPKSNDEPNEDLVNSEMRKTIIATLVKNDEDVKWYYKYFSSFKKIVRMLAWIFRFYDKVRKVDKNLSRDLSVQEIEKGEKVLMLLIQKESFKGENDEKLRQLRPIVDCHGLIRARSNVIYRDDKYDFKFPIILPSDHPVVKLLIMSVHNDLLHAGTSLLMSNLRERYWILKSRMTIRNCIRKCVKCQKFKAKKCEAIPGILPEDRVRDACVFEIIGCDLAGPLYLKDGRKAYIVLFTCAVYRAVHLELITSLSTECFFQSLRRFIARRGRPSTIYSDNGKNFQGADKFLQTIDWDGLRFKAAEQKIQWKFNPPSAPWWGGWWGRLIRIVKQILRKILGHASLDYEELLTVLCDCERVVNSRPLTYVSEDIDEDFAITPEKFLHETPQSGVPDIDNVDKVKLSKRTKYLQRIRETLRFRFRTGYLGQLRQQSIKCYKNESLKVGEIVLLEDTNKKRSYWNLARVLKVIPGRDGQIRLALIKTNNTELLRPIQRLFRLELEIPIQETNGETTPLTTSSGRIVKSPVR